MFGPSFASEGLQQGVFLLYNGRWDITRGFIRGEGGGLTNGSQIKALNLIL